MRAEPGDPGSQSRESDDRIAATTSAAGAGGSVFVTVGTTRFDALVEVVDSRECRAALKQRGFTSVVVQRGRGTYKPAEGDPDSTGVTVTSFEFAPSMAPYIKQADLVISHAGSGSIFEALRASKPLVVVVNGALMDNHQRELAGALAHRHHLVQAVPESLVATVRDMDLGGLVPYPPPEAEKYAQAIDEFLGSELTQRHVVQAVPGSLVATVREMDLEGLVLYPPPEAEKYAQAIDAFLGF